jgi:hypothetical protein
MEFNAIPRMVEGAIFRTLDQEAVVLNVDSGAYYVLNETATMIWNLIDGKQTLHDIVEKLCTDYQVSCEKAEQSLQRLMKDLSEAHLVVLQPSVPTDSKD